MERLGRACYGRRWRVLILWIVGFVAVGALSGAVGTAFSNNFGAPGTESQRAFDLLRGRFPAQAGDTAEVVFRASSGIDDPTVKSRIEALLYELATLPHVRGIESPYGQRPGKVSRDRQTAFASVQFDAQAGDIERKDALALRDRALGASNESLQVEVGGGIIQQAEFEGPGSREAIGFVFATLILLLTFGSLIASGLPLITAVFGLGIGIGIVTLVTHAVDMPEFAPSVATMIGIGVGIDYALLVVTRFRQSLHAGLDPEEATVVAMTTAGRSVLFAGCTVVISLLGMITIGQALVTGIALGAVAAVLVVMLASVTLLPAILGFAGEKIDRLHIRLPLVGGHQTDHRLSLWYRWSRLMQRHPWRAGLSALVVLVALAVPFFSIRLAFTDAGNASSEKTIRRAYDLLSEGFGPGFNGPLLIVAELPGLAGLDAFTRLGQQLATTPGIAFTTPAQPNPQGDTAVLFAYPTTSPQEEVTTALVHRLRRDVIPTAISGTGLRVSVAGITAAGVDNADILGARLPVFIGAVLIVSFLLLMTVYRSLLVPLKAGVMNLLSIGAAYGVVVAIFQWGWLKDLVGVGKAGPIEPWAPMMLFAVLFGLSMDYEVFLLSRIQEEYLRTRDNATAVADGVATTARVITAAAAIMIMVFLSFVLGDDRTLKLMGIGLASAIFIDATIVRSVLVPATMQLLGDANWWLPRWLGRLLPRIHVEPPEVARRVDEAELDELRRREPEPVG